MMSLFGVAIFLFVGWGARLLLRKSEQDITYATLKEARADGVFERGWLPDILPASSHRIRTANSLDLNTSVGSFWFAPADYQHLAAHLAPYSSLAPNLKAAELEDRQHGIIASVFKDAGSIWVFRCKPQKGRCEYSLIWTPEMTSMEQQVTD